MSQPLIVRRPRVLSPRSRYLFGFLSSLMLGMLLLGSPPSVAAQTCAETDTAVSGISGTKVVSGNHNDIVDDCTTLLGLKDTLRGTATLNWARTLAMTSWDGLTNTNAISGTPPRVTKLELSWQNLSGTIPSALGNLTGLTVLDLSGNDFTGTLPDLSDLSSLTTLNLYFNLSLTDEPIPDWINDLTSLTTLDLRWTNRAYLSADAIPDLSALTSLTTFRLAGGLSYSDGRNRPAFPDLSASTSLQDLSIIATPLASGPIPAWVSDLSALQTLDLRAARRTGSIPDLSSLSSLQNLDLSINNLTAGAIPTWMTTKSSLRTLNLSNTNRTGAIPALSSLTNLRVLSLGTTPFRANAGFDNAFTAGAIPTLSALTSLQELNLNNTNRTGTIPALSALTSLQELNLGDNKLTGAIPALNALDDLQELDLSDNSFSAGAFPTLHSSVSGTLTHLDLGNTNRNGTFPTLSSYTNLWHLDLSDNAFTAGDIPDLSALTSLDHLNLRNTNRTGTIPTTLGSLTLLSYLDLSENALTGDIPSWLGDLYYLTHLYLNNNQLTGDLPSGLNRSNLDLRLGSNTSDFGDQKEISIATTADTLDSSFATFDSATDPCGTVTGTLPASPTLREAIIYANNTTAAETISFAPRLNGQTITLADGTDTGDDADPLPALCGGSLTLDGDGDNDGSPDITLDGTDLPDSADGLDIRSSNNTINGLSLTNIPDGGIRVWHTNDFTETVANNTLTDNTVTGGQYGLVVQAGAGTTAGAVSRTTIRGNTVTAATSVGIAVSPAAGSTISTTTVEENEVYANTGHAGIAAWSEGVNTALVNSITTLKIADNHVYDQTAGSGIAVTSGFCGGAYNRIEAEISGNTLSKNGKADEFADIAAGAGSNAEIGDCDTLPSPNTTGNNHLDITITDNLSEDTPDTGIAVSGGFKQSDSNTVTATVARNAVWRSATAGIRVSGGTDSSDSNTVTATLNDNLIARTTQLTTGNAGHGLAVVAAAAEPSASSTSSSNTLTVNGQGNIISIARNDSDTSHYDLYRRQNNNASNPTRTGNTLTDTLTGTIFKTAPSDNDGLSAVTPVNPVTIPDNHFQVADSTFTPVSAPVGAGLPSNTQFSAGGQVFSIMVLNSISNDAVTTSLHKPVQVCLPIPAGVSTSQVYVLRYNPTTHAWERQTAGRTTTGGQVCADITQFSLFTVGSWTGTDTGDTGDTGGTGGGGGGGGGGTPEPAVLRNFFESPATGAVVSGVDLIRGWSFAEQAGVQIEQVALFIDRQRYALIPCCSSRPDVAAAFPTAPAANAGQSGWGITLNWGNLSAGPHSLQVVVTSTDEGRWASDLHTVTVVKPGGIAFADRFSLAEAEARLDGAHLVLNGGVLRDAQTRDEQEIVARYGWQTGAQGLRLVSSRTLEVARAPTVGVNRLLAGVVDWGRRWLSPSSVTANEGLDGYWEAPAAGAAVAGIGLIRGWAFPIDTTDEIATVTVQIDGTRTEDAPCCSTRPDIVDAFPDQANAELSGWGLVTNYGNLSEGEHRLVAEITTEAGVAAPPETRTITVSRLGGYAFVNQFDLSGAEVDLVGEDIILSGVEVRDGATQETQEIEVRLQWSAATQGLVIVGTETMP